MTNKKQLNKEDKVLLFREDEIMKTHTNCERCMGYHPPTSECDTEKVIVMTGEITFAIGGVMRIIFKLDELDKLRDILLSSESNEDIDLEVRDIDKKVINNLEPI